MTSFNQFTSPSPKTALGIKDPDTVNNLIVYITQLQKNINNLGSTDIN